MSTTKKISIAAGLLLLAGAFIYVYADWFKPKQVQIFYSTRALRSPKKRWRAGQDAQAPLVLFGFDRKLMLTEVKVVPVAALATNQTALAVWHLVSDSNSVPVKFIAYGNRVQGMKPFVQGARPQPLETNVTYRLFVKAGSVEGQHDFTVGTR